MSAIGTELSRCWYFRLMFSLEEKGIQNLNLDMGTGEATAGELSSEECGQELPKTLTLSATLRRRWCGDILGEFVSPMEKEPVRKQF